MTFDANSVRMSALELRENMLALYAAVLPLYKITSAWTLNNVDLLLPLPFDVRVMQEAYKKLKIKALKLTESDALLLTAQPGDTLAIVSTPNALTFDGGAVFG